MYGLHGNLKATEGNGDRLATILLQACALMTALDECHNYIVSIEPDNSDSIWVTEIWDTKEAHDQSLSNPVVRSLIGQAMPLLEGMPEKGQELKVLNTKK